MPKVLVTLRCGAFVQAAAGAVEVHGAGCKLLLLQDERNAV